MLQAKSGSDVTKQRELKGGAQETTNNRMEMTAVIKGLEAIDPSAPGLISSDSTYVFNTMTKCWKRKVNNDLLDQLDRLVKNRDVLLLWLRGHRRYRGNELAVSCILYTSYAPEE